MIVNHVANHRHRSPNAPLPIVWRENWHYAMVSPTLSMTSHHRTYLMHYNWHGIYSFNLGATHGRTRCVPSTWHTWRVIVLSIVCIWLPIHCWVSLDFSFFFFVFARRISEWFKLFFSFHFSLFVPCCWIDLRMENLFVFLLLGTFVKAHTNNIIYVHRMVFRRKQWITTAISTRLWSTPTKFDKQLRINLCRQCSFHDFYYYVSFLCRCWDAGECDL